MDSIELKNKSLGVNKIFKFVIKENLVEDFSLDKINNSAKIFFENEYHSLSKKNKLDIINELDEYSFFNIKGYNFDKKEKSKLFKLILVLSIFKSEIIKLLENKKLDYPDYGPLKRKASPSLETYEYVGNNKLEIHPTNRSYGLLFE